MSILRMQHMLQRRITNNIHLPTGTLTNNDILYILLLKDERKILDVLFPFKNQDNSALNTLNK